MLADTTYGKRKTAFVLVLSHLIGIVLISLSFAAAEAAGRSGGGYRPAPHSVPRGGLGDRVFEPSTPPELHTPEYLPRRIENLDYTLPTPGSIRLEPVRPPSESENPQNPNTKTLHDFGYRNTQKSIEQFQRDHALTPTGILDGPSLQEIKNLQDLEIRSSASDGQFLVVDIGRPEKATRGLYRVSIAGEHTKLFRKSDEVGRYVARIAKKRGIYKSYLVPHMTVKEAAGLRASMRQQSRNHKEYILDVKRGSKEGSAIQIALLEPRGTNSKASVTIEPHRVTSGRWKGRQEATYRVETKRGGIALRVIAKTKKALTHFFERLQYHLEKLDVKFSVAVAVHRAKLDTMKAYHITDSQLTVHVEEQSENTQIANSLWNKDRLAYAH